MEGNLLLMCEAKLIDRMMEQTKFLGFLQRRFNDVKSNLESLEWVLKFNFCTYKHNCVIFIPALQASLK